MNETQAQINSKFIRMAREISSLKRKANIAREKQIVAEARSNDSKLRAKSAENSVKELDRRHALALRAIDIFTDAVELRKCLAAILAGKSLTNPIKLRPKP